MDHESIDLEHERAQFDPDWYLAQNQDVAKAIRDGHWGGVAWNHYVDCGRREGRAPWAPQKSDPVPVAPSADENIPPMADHSGAGFLSPTDLSVTETELTRVAMIGSCTMQGWGFQDKNPSNCPVDLIVMNNMADMPNLPEEVLNSYDFVVLQIPLRSVMRDDMLWHLDYDDESGYERAFQQVTETLDFQLHNRLVWNRERSMLAFVANFFTPQFKPMGCLFPRYDLRNPEYFIDRLNQHLELAVRQYKNAYVLDIDRLSASVGRRYIQDDGVAVFGHNGFQSFVGPNFNRIEPMASMTAHYELRWHDILPDIIWAELLKMYRTVRQTDAVKLVVVDLDDTLWAGVSGEMTSFDVFMVEGWPSGFAEALIYLKRRGVLLAIVSKNEESRIREIWGEIYGNSLRLEDFAAVRINWRPKSENVREILEGMNLLPRSVLFIDDNPVEREAMKAAFPDIRVLGRYPYYLRRTLLLAPETQVITVTSESGRRTEMIQSQFDREAERRQLSRGGFLRSAAPVVTLLTIENTDHPRFARVFELLNKTNQFNTTGRRWALEKMELFLHAGGRIIAFEVKDKFTSYGLVGVILLRSNHIEQWIMSCRVLGYQIEEAVMAAIVERIRKASSDDITGRLVHTDVNFPCRDLFRRCAFIQKAGSDEWYLGPDAALVVPDHVKLDVIVAK